jgi:hypothetical protein
MSNFFAFMASTTGRGVRIVAGLILIALSLWTIERELWRWVLIIIGLVPSLAGVFDVCVFAPLFGLPFVGNRLRRNN